MRDLFWKHKRRYGARRTAVELAALGMPCGVETLDVAAQPESVRQTHRQQLTYFRNHAHRMNYPTYVANGWQFGSGPVESACKTVVGNRLKGGGMRWGPAGANAACHLRATYLSDPSCWNTLWRQAA